MQASNQKQTQPKQPANQDIAPQDTEVNLLAFDKFIHVVAKNSPNG